MSKEPYPSEKADRFIVRFPDGMREQIRLAAERNGRSMNSEIVQRLQATLEMDRYTPSENVHPEPTFQNAELIDIVKAEVDRMNQFLNALIKSAEDPKSPLNEGRKK